ncbi:hypothetical protein KW842_12325 [Duganella sp. sic0402]|uniref:hypothetical protein n=1 Tax=Duganella sp. sic0402 TaxID=2854786 RepID=UPI001C47E034|nr:hypothetical protein [Duganella sp. sic0402]MBV7536553.1 hypothetical protein [Duganella sp. sic0402]
MPPRRAIPGMAVVVALHLALLWLALRPVQRPAVRDNRVWLQLPLHPMPFPLPQVDSWFTPERKPALPKAPRQPRPPAIIAAPEPAPMVTADSPEVAALLAPPAPVPSPSSSPPADVVRQALQDVAAIDRQLRAEHPQPMNAEPGALSARLAKGMAAAHAAVKPKWFEQARIELISAPNDPKRIYRVTTALGEYCLYYPDTGSIAFNSNAKSGHAGAGQPKVAGCPVPF